MKFKFLIFILIILGVGGGFGYYKLKDKSSIFEVKKQDAWSEKIKENNEGKVESATLDQEKILVAPASGFSQTRTQSLKLELEEGVVAYLVVSQLEDDSVVSLIPYKNLPTGKDHPALFDNLGKGVQVILENIDTQKQNIYLVFDLGREKTDEKIVKAYKYYNRCDPFRVYFDPLICAFRKEQALDVYNRRYVVVRPIFNFRKESSPLLATSSSNSGINDLVTARIKESGVYVPQEIDADLANDILVQSLVEELDYPSEKVEAGIIAVEWQQERSINYPQLYAIEKAFNNEDINHMMIAAFYGDEMADLAIDNIEQEEEEIENEEGDNNKDEEEQQKEKEDQEKAKERWRDAQGKIENIHQEAIPNLIKNIDKKILNNKESQFFVKAAVVTRGFLDLGELANSREEVENLAKGLENFWQAYLVSQETEILFELNNTFEALMIIKNGNLGDDLKKDFLKKFQLALEKYENLNFNDLLYSAQIAESYLNDEELVKSIIDKIKTLAENKFNNSESTSADLLEVVAIARQLEFNTLADLAFNKAGEVNINRNEECQKIMPSLEKYGIKECLVE